MLLEGICVSIEKNRECRHDCINGLDVVDAARCAITIHFAYIAIRNENC